MNFNEIDETNPLFPILLSFRKNEQRMIENLTKYLPKTKRRYIHVPFFYSNIRHFNSLVFPTVLYDNIIYTAVYDKFAEHFINIRDEKDNIIIDLQPKRKRCECCGRLV